MSGYEDYSTGCVPKELRTSAIIMTQRMNARKQPASGRAGVIVLEKPYAPDKLIGCVSKALFPDQS